MKTIAFVFFFLLISVLNSPAQSAFQVVVKGKGQPILLFPGFGCTGEVWNEAVAELSKTHQCHIFTFAGFGNVPPVEMPWLSKIKDGVIAYVKENKLKKPTLLGHSLGGTLSLWLASVEPDMFNKIIVVDALPAARFGCVDDSQLQWGGDCIRQSAEHDDAGHGQCFVCSYERADGSVYVQECGETKSIG